MRTLFLLCIASLGLGCTKLRTCKDGTVFLNVVFNGDIRAADQLELKIGVNQSQMQTTKFSHTIGEASGTVEIDFPEHYPAGATVTVEVTASAMQTQLGTGSATFTAAPGCTAAQVTLGRGDAPDMSGHGGAVLSLVAGTVGGFGYRDDVGANARFDSPIGIAVDHAGNLYVADSANTAIRKIALATGAVSTLAGHADSPGSMDGVGDAARFGRALGGLVSDGANLYVADSVTVRQIAVATGTVSTLAGSSTLQGNVDGIGPAARFQNVTGITGDGAGALYVVDAGNFAVRKLTIASRAVTTLTDSSGNAIRFDLPSGIANDRAGNLYITEVDFETILKLVIATGTVTTLAGSLGQVGTADGVGAAARFHNPFGLTIDNANTLYIADSGNHTIRRLVPATTTVTTIAGSGQNGHADGIGAAAQLSAAMGIASDDAGALYVADTDNHAVRKLVLATGAVTTLAGAAPVTGNADGTSTVALFNGPTGATTDNAGNVYVADTYNHEIRKIEVATGAVTRVAGAGTAGATDGVGSAATFNQPTDVASNGVNALYIADTANHTIRMIDLANAAVMTLAGAAAMAGTTDGAGANARFALPAGLVSDGSNLYVADTGNSTIRKIDLSSRMVTTLAGSAGATGSVDGVATAALFNHPEGMTLDGAGNLYVVDSGNHTIRRVVLATGAVTTFAGTAGVRGSADGTGAAAQFRSPQRITYDGAGSFYAADTGNGTIRKLALATGAVVTWAGVAGLRGVRLGAAPAGLNRPDGIVVSPTGALIIVDNAENAVLSLH